ncbi:hypothetical protein QQP08_016948 [Theobroma cacao]|nr:hypothetical protein QQP08_016948 [Theobroma cacao]
MKFRLHTNFHVMIMEEDQDEDDVFIVMPMHFKDRISDLSEKSPPVDNTHFKRAATGENSEGVLASGEDHKESWLPKKIVMVEKTIVASRSLLKNSHLVLTGFLRMRKKKINVVN